MNQDPNDVFQIFRILHVALVTNSLWLLLELFRAMTNAISRLAQS
jgi:hypothetical protein